MSRHKRRSSCPGGRQRPPEVVRTDGSFSFGPPEAYFGLYASALTAMRERAVGAGLTTGQDIDAIVASLAAAQPAAD